MLEKLLHNHLHSSCFFGSLTDLVFMLRIASAYDFLLEVFWNYYLRSLK